MEPKKGDLLKKFSVYAGTGVILVSMFAGLFLVFTVRSSMQYTSGPEQPEENFTFPVGVDPVKQVVTEDPRVDSYFEEHILVHKSPAERKMTWLGRAVGKLALFDWYQNLASVSSRLLVVLPGERKEEIVTHFSKILRWDEGEQKAFRAYLENSEPMLADGKLLPGKYTVSKDAIPEEIGFLLQEAFEREVLARYSTTTDELVPLKDALTIASMLEREAYDFTDMRLISGVIWNRLFIDMNLQIDATLQYAKGSREDQPWWPPVRPEDKYIDSPYNTYEHGGLPPEPISNPSIEAILAALNPRKTECLYYFHDRDAGFHCSKTYEEHVTLLKEYYGKGR